MPAPLVIIIAEPDPIFGNMLRVEFTQVGFAVLMAGSGPEAEGFASQTAARLLLLDTALPEPTSFDACARIRHMPQHERTPIILTARHYNRRIEEAAIIAGASLLLIKPYAFADLTAALAPRLPPDHPLLVARTSVQGLAEAKGVVWGPLPPLRWKAAAGSGLSQNAKVLPIVRGPGARLPLIRKS